MPPRKRGNSSTNSSKAPEPPGDGLGLPDFSEESVRLAALPPPTFEAQLRHAAMLIEMRRKAGLPVPSSPPYPVRFRL